MTTAKVESEPFKCFISYANADAEIAHAIADALRSTAKWEVISDRDINPGDSWRRQLEDKVKDADFFVVLVSPAALSSRFVRDEWASIQERAWGSGKVGILPVLVGEADAPAFLKHWQSIDAADKKPTDMTKFVTNYLRNLGDRLFTPEQLHKNPPEEATERTDRFRGLIASLPKDKNEWSF